MRERHPLRRAPREERHGFGVPESSDLATWVACEPRGAQSRAVAETIACPVAELDATRSILEVRS